MCCREHLRKGKGSNEYYSHFQNSNGLEIAFTYLGLKVDTGTTNHWEQSKMSLFPKGP